MSRTELYSTLLVANIEQLVLIVKLSMIQLFHADRVVFVYGLHFYHSLLTSLSPLSYINYAINT